MTKPRQAKQDQNRSTDASKNGLRRSARTAAKQSQSQPNKESNAVSASGQKRKNTKDLKEEDDPAAKKQRSNSKSTSQRETVGSKHDKADAPAAQGSNKRLPVEGQTAHWKAMPGWVSGQVLQILTKDKKVEDKNVKATEDQPRIVLKSNAKSGKICVHKPDNVYFDD